MNENETQQNETIDENFKVYLIDDMADIYIRDLSPMFNNVTIYDFNSYIKDFQIDESYNQKPFCLIFDASYFDNSINDYVISYAERLIRQYPFMKNHIKILLGNDMYMRHKTDSLRGAVESKQFLYRVQHLPHTLFSNKIVKLHDTILSMATNLNYKIQDNTLQPQNLPEEFQTEINSLYTNLLNIINYLKFGVDIDRLTQQIQIVSNPKHKNSLIETLKEYRQLNVHAEHTLQQYTFFLASIYRAKTTLARVKCDVKRLTDIQSILQNKSERSKILLQTLNGPINNLENMLKTSDKIIFQSFKDDIKDIKIALIKIEDNYNQLVFLIRLVLGTEKLDPKELPIIAESGEDE